MSVVFSHAVLLFSQAVTDVLFDHIQRGLMGDFQEQFDLELWGKKGRFMFNAGQSFTPVFKKDYMIFGLMGDIHGTKMDKLDLPTRKNFLPPMDSKATDVM